MTMRRLFCMCIMRILCFVNEIPEVDEIANLLSVTLFF